MQQVDRKSHRESPNSSSRRRVILAAALAVLLAGVTAAVLLLSRPPADSGSQEKEEPGWGLLIERTPEDLVSITVKRRGEASWTLLRTEDGDLIPAESPDSDPNASWKVSEQQSALLQETLTQLRYEEILSEDPALLRDSAEDFGLADPSAAVTARYRDGTEITLLLGSDTGLEEGWHYLAVEGEDRLYAVASAVAADLDVEYALLHPVPRPEIYGALLDRITVMDGEKVIAEWQLQGSPEDRDAASRWTVTDPFRYPADEEAVKNLKKSAENLRLGAYKGPATQENLEQYGFDIPRRILIFHMAAGSTGAVSDLGVYDITDHPESEVTLIVGNSVDDLASYVRFGDDLYTVSTFTLEPFTDPDPMATVARYPVLIPLDSLESVTVEEDGETLEYRLVEAESPQTENQQEESEEPARICLLNGTQISMESFEAAWDRLLTVTFSGLLPEGAVWQSPYKKYTFRTRSGGTHTLELSDWDGLHDAVTVDGCTLFYLIRGGMTPLPELPPSQ